MYHVPEGVLFVDLHKDEKKGGYVVFCFMCHVQRVGAILQFVLT